MKTSIIVCMALLICGLITTNIASAITDDDLSRASELLAKNNIKLNDNMKIIGIRNWANAILVDVEQYYKDIPIHNSYMIYTFEQDGTAEVNREGVIKCLGNTIDISKINVDIVPFITEDTAIETFNKYAKSDNKPYSKPIAMLKIFNIYSGRGDMVPTYKLYWHVMPTAYKSIYILLDALTGEVFFYDNGIRY